MARPMILFLVALVLILATSVYEPPPDSVKLEFGAAEHLLKDTVYHNVKDFTRYYVDRVMVELNGGESIEQTIKSPGKKEAQVGGV